MKRLPDWRARFERTVDELRARPFDWSQQHDCFVGLVAPLVAAVTGADVAQAYRGRYASMRGAVRVMRNDGFKNLADLVATILPEQHPSMAKIGDIVAIPVDDPFGFSLGVVNGERVFVLRPDMAGTVDLLQSTRAFKVG
jgi:hypothetical protein